MCAARFSGFRKSDAGQFFSTAMRILFEHIMDTLSPEEMVSRSSWFTDERDHGKPTRGQRIKFAIQGGFLDAFVIDELKVDPRPLQKRLLITFEKLSDQVHCRENSIIRNSSDQNAMAGSTLSAMADFLDAVQECRAAVLRPVAEALDEAAVEVLVREGLEEVDELASHCHLDEVYVGSISVHEIGSFTITYRVTGSVAVILQFGSNSDVKRGDGAEVEQSFPFQCDIEVLLEDPWNLVAAESKVSVDTSEGVCDVTRRVGINISIVSTRLSDDCDFLKYTPTLGKTGKTCCQPVQA
jgi:hypothetical protein